MPQPSPSDALLARMLDIADHYAAAGDQYRLDRLRITAREYADALVQLQRALNERERLLARLAVIDERVSLSEPVASFLERL